MGNVLETCPNNGILLSDINLSNPEGTCVRDIVYYVVVGNGLKKIL